MNETQQTQDGSAATVQTAPTVAATTPVCTPGIASPISAQGPAPTSAPTSTGTTTGSTTGTTATTGGTAVTPGTTSCTAQPAPQPSVPRGNCTALPPPPDAPVPPVPTVHCKPPDCCPKDPAPSSSCLDAAIDEQQKLIGQAERAKAFKTELEGFAQKAKAGRLDYTAAKYQLLLERWKAEDKDIVALIARLVCTMPCWHQQVECFICPLLYDIKLTAESLNGEAGLYVKVYSLLDMRYWRQRDLGAKQETFDRIRAVLGAWEKPAATIDAALTENAAAIDLIRKGLGTPDAGKLIYDLFVRVISTHLAIAPPSATTTTGIDKKYVALCACDTATPDDCCGPDTGVPSVLIQLLGPKPYLVAPDQYDGIICCLVQNRYVPAKNALADADAELKAIEDRIARATTAIADKKKSFEADAKAKLALPFDCCPKPAPPVPMPPPAPVPPPAPTPPPCAPPVAAA